MDEEKILSEKESLALITKMINRAKDSYYETGRSAMLWGAVIAFCSLVKLSEIQFDYRLPFDIYLLTFVAVIPQVYISIKEKKERKVVSYDDAYLNYLWLGFGICVFLMIVITNSIASNLHPLVNDYREITKNRVDWIDFRFSEYVSPLFLLLYGLPTFVTGAACKFKPMVWGGILCWASSIVAIYTPIRIDLLLTAFSAIMAWLIPGIIMKNQYKKEQAKLDV
jgi:uncharacterized protein with PQ loop repeat